MRKSELKEIIKSAMLEEAQDSKKGNKEEQERMEGAIRDDRDHIKDLEDDIKDNEKKLAKLKKDFKDDVNEGNAKYYEDSMKEEEEAEEEVEITDTEEEIAPELEGDTQDVLTHLESALEAARVKGDEKLINQIGNTITFFTRQYVVKEEDLFEMKRMKRLAGILK